MANNTIADLRALEQDLRYEHKRGRTASGDVTAASLCGRAADAIAEYIAALDQPRAQEVPSDSVMQWVDEALRCADRLSNHRSRELDQDAAKALYALAGHIRANAHQQQQPAERKFTGLERNGFDSEPWACDKPAPAPAEPIDAPAPPIPVHGTGTARATSAPAEPSASLQDRIQPWLLQCFGAEIAADRVERNHRFLEESLELVQALGCTESEAHQLVDYTFGRPAGNAAQEVGGAMITLAALCLANGFDMHAEGETELARIWQKIGAIRAKQAAKPKHLPLPAEPSAGQWAGLIEEINLNLERDLSLDAPERGLMRRCAAALAEAQETISKRTIEHYQTTVNLSQTINQLTSTESRLHTAERTLASAQWAGLISITEVVDDEGRHIRYATAPALASDGRVACPECGYEWSADLIAAAVNEQVEQANNNWRTAVERAKLAERTAQAAIALLANVLDVWDDADKPEDDRTYVPGAMRLEFDRIRTFLAAHPQEPKT